MTKSFVVRCLALILVIGAAASPALAQQQKKRMPPAAASKPQPVPAPALAPAQTAGKPNIIVIWGDDIGQSNLSAYTNGLMGYRTPNIDSIAKKG